MQPRLGRTPLHCALIFALALLSGCALTKENAAINYVPQANVTKKEGAEKVKVQVSVSDGRAIKDRVSVKKNGYGMEMAAIVSNEDVTQTLKKALEVELSNRGFTLAEGDVTVLAELSKFWNDFKNGWFSGDAVAELTMSLQVKKPDGNIVFAKAINGNGTKPNIQLASGKNAEIALKAALQDAVAQALSEPAFTEALFKASKSCPSDLAADKQVK